MRTSPRGDGVRTLDAGALRASIPALADGVAHFESPGGTLCPRPVADAVAQTLLAPIANRGTVTEAERRAEACVAAGRSAVADLLGGQPHEVVFGRSMTQLTMDLSRALASTWSPGDEIVVTDLEHDANVTPWIIAARRAGVTVRVARFDVETGELPVDRIASHLSPRTRVVAVTAASNLIGTMPDVAAVAEVVHDAGAQLFVDAVHFSAHAAVDVAALGADYAVCSPYKFLGPHCGALWGRAALLEELSPDKLAPSPDTVPERFELGTLPYEFLAGTAAAVDVLASLAPGDPGWSRRQRLLASMAAVEAAEDRLRRRIEDGLQAMPGVVVHSRAARRSPTLAVTFDGGDAPAVSRHLAEQGVNAPAGTFYAARCAERLGLPPGGALRIGLAPYNDDRDVDRLLAALASRPDQPARSRLTQV